MKALLTLSRAIDGLNTRIGRGLIWLVLAAVLISAVNAIVRKAFDISSNAFLETQWYLFSADLPALLAVHAAAQRAHPDRRRRRPAVEPRADLDRRVRHRLLPAADGADDHVPVVGRVHALVEHQRNVEQCGRARHLAGAAPGAGGLLPAVAAGHLAADQAASRTCAGRDPIRTRGTTPSRRRRNSPRRSSGRGARRNDRVPDRQHGAADVRGAGRLPADGLPGGVRAGGQRHRVRPDRDRTGAAAAFAVRRHAGAAVGGDVERHAAGDSVLHLHGVDPRAFRHGRGPARHDRAAVRADSRRPRVCGDLRRRAAGGDDRCRGRERDLDGPHLAADHAPLRLRPADRLRHHRGVRHARADHPALARAHHHGRPARPVGRRHVRRRLHPGHRAGQPVRRLHRARLVRQAGMGAGPARGSADDSRARRLGGNALAGRAVRTGHDDRRRLLVPVLQPVQARSGDGRAHRPLRECRGRRGVLRVG